MLKKAKNAFLPPSIDIPRKEILPHIAAPGGPRAPRGARDPDMRPDVTPTGPVPAVCVLCVLCGAFWAAMRLRQQAVSVFLCGLKLYAGTSETCEQKNECRNLRAKKRIGAGTCDDCSVRLTDLFLSPMRENSGRVNQVGGHVRPFIHSSSKFLGD